MSENLPFKREEGDEGGNQELKQSKGVCYLTLLQDTSKPCKKSLKDHYVEGAEAGKFYLSTPKKVLNGEIDIVVLDFFKYVVEVNPNNELDIYGRYTLAQANADRIISNPGDWSGVWTTKEGHPLILHYGYIVKVLGHEEEGVAQYSFKKGGIKDAERLNSLLDRKAPDGKDAATHMQVITLKAKGVSNDNGAWFGLEPSWKGWVNEDQYKDALETKKLMSPVSEQIKLEDKSEKKEAEDEKVDY